MQRALLLLIALIALCSLLAGCGGKALELPPAPVVEARQFAPAPQKPLLPQVRPQEPLETPRNVRTLLERDDVMRRHINALHDWAAQVPQRPREVQP